MGEWRTTGMPDALGRFITTGTLQNKHVCLLPEVLARSAMLVYKNATNSTVLIAPSDMPTIRPSNLSRARVVMYETWTASLHWIRTLGPDTISLGNPYDDRVSSFTE
jgi:hypothetical protein